MSKKKQAKPTNKDRDQAINQLMGNVGWLKNQFELIGRLFDAYILWKGDQDEFMKHIDKLKGEYAAQQKEAADEAKGDAEGDVEPSGESPSNEG